MTIDVVSSYPGVDISYIKNNTVDLNKIHKPLPVRWGVGIMGGYGITNKGITPYLGIGVTYTFKGLK
jgi:opacity protein-like surface antigen